MGSRNVYADVQPDPEAVVSTDEPAEAEIVSKEVDSWSIIWYLVLAAVGGIILAGIIKGLVENGDVEVCVMASSHFPLGRSALTHDPQFDFKKAFKQALGGGLSGAAGMNVMCIA